MIASALGVSARQDVCRIRWLAGTKYPPLQGQPAGIVILFQAYWLF
jgi:hypothetical protein